MAKVRVHELAKELNIQSKDIISFLTENNIEKRCRPAEWRIPRWKW
ncbi:translation initiation factor IF-2 N-terminal domain-containing protein [Roseburia sp. 1XD42-69]|nr:translation initiation factor IF-2 N-terminal domain-containing protein [Roseburia sp. 1XD42-69]RKJ68414.1 hypothetical protein D7Y06_01565 [Roseburia sp. 1XD42-69]